MNYNKSQLPMQSTCDNKFNGHDVMNSSNIPLNNMHHSAGGFSQKNLKVSYPNLNNTYYVPKNLNMTQGFNKFNDFDQSGMLKNVQEEKDLNGYHSSISSSRNSVQSLSNKNLVAIPFNGFDGNILINS